MSRPDRPAHPATVLAHGVGRVRERLALAVIAAVSAVVLVAVGALLLGNRTPSGDLDVSALPGLNAALNGTSAVLLVAGYVLVRRRRLSAHLACMLGALGVSTLFLVSYVVYHYHAGSRPFAGEGWIRPVYFFFLITHIVLAAGIVPLALTTVYRGLAGRLDRHVRLARWTLPIWLYVSVTGVLIYWMLHRM
jgi:putative membrane protein